MSSWQGSNQSRQIKRSLFPPDLELLRISIDIIEATHFELQISYPNVFHIPNHAEADATGRDPKFGPRPVLARCASIEELYR